MWGCRSRRPLAPSSAGEGAARPRVAGRLGWVVLAAAEPPGPASSADTRSEIGSTEEATEPRGRAVSTGPILVVDDDPALRQTVSAILIDEGYPVAEAADGAEALECVERLRPSLILLDMRMPVLDGWGFARTLRARDIRVPIVVMTAARDAQRWAEEIAADDWLAKPFELLDLLATVERLRRS